MTNPNPNYSSEQIRVYVSRKTLAYIDRYAEIKGYGRSRATDELAQFGIDTVFVRDDADL